VNDLPRVMRLAGFIHRKGVPFLSRLVHTSDHEPYEWSEIHKFFDSVVQLDFTRKNATGNDSKREAAATSFEVPTGLEADDQYVKLGAGIETDQGWDRLSPEHKDAALNHGLERIAKNSKLLQLKAYVGSNTDYHALVTSIARSDAPHAEDIFIRYASKV